MSDQLLGIEIDGDRVTVVETLGDVAVSAHTVDLGTLAESLEVALGGLGRKRKDPPIRVSLVAPSTTLRRIDVTAQVAASRDAFEDAVFAALPVSRETSAAAGAFYDRERLTGDNVTGGVAVVAPLETVAQVYRALGRTRSEVTAAPLNVRGVDGIWVGLNHSAAEVTLVSGGHAVAYRQLRTGGLATVEALIAPDDAALARRRITSQLTSTGPQDPGVASELARYLRLVAAEIQQTVEYWRRSGEQVPDTNELVTYGAAGAAPQLAPALEEYGFARHLPERLLEALTYLPLADRERALGAYLAAISVGDSMPQAAFANPVETEQLAAIARKRRVALITGGGVTAVGALAVLVVGPLAMAWNEARESRAELAEAHAAYAPFEGVYHQTQDLRIRREIVEDARAEQANWVQVLATVYDTAPLQATVTQLSATSDGADVLVTLAVSVPGSSYDPLASWLTDLRGTEDVIEAWSSGFSQAESETEDESDVTAQISFRLSTAPVPDESAGPDVADETDLLEEVLQ